MSIWGFVIGSVIAIILLFIFGAGAIALEKRLIELEKQRKALRDEDF